MGGKQKMVSDEHMQRTKLCSDNAEVGELSLKSAKGGNGSFPNHAFCKKDYIRKFLCFSV